MNYIEKERRERAQDDLLSGECPSIVQYYSATETEEEGEVVVI